jgi:Holliday junction resolvase RusA-like endonuclease
MGPIHFTIPGQPVAKGRPRFSTRGGFVKTYTPEKTANYESLVKMAAAEAMSGAIPSIGPIALELVLMLQVPASWSKKKQDKALFGTVCATKKPDADNVLKGIKDGCNGIVWKDDAQVVQISIQKKYSAMPRAIVSVRELPGEPA